MIVETDQLIRTVVRQHGECAARMVVPKIILMTKHELRAIRRSLGVPDTTEIVQTWMLGMRVIVCDDPPELRIYG